MVYFYNGNNATNYVTLTKSTTDVNTCHKEANDKTSSIYERILKRTQCKGDVMMLKIITVILLLAVLALSYTTYIEHNEIKLIRLSIAGEEEIQEEKVFNETSVCNFSIGYGYGGSKLKIGYQVGNSCINACLHMKKIDPTINGVTVYVDASKGGCWCEQNMRSVGGLFKTCFLKSDIVQESTDENGTSTCLFTAGDGVGGSHFKIGNQKGNACINACLHLKKIDDSINGVTLYSNTTKKGCWCGQHMTSIRSSSVFKTCFLKSNTTQIKRHLNVTSACKFSIGDGEGGTEINVGYQKGDACIHACLHMRKIDASINGITAYTNINSRGCWCEKNMTRISGTYKTCFLRLP